MLAGVRNVQPRPSVGPQVPRGPGGELGPPGQPRLARHRPLAADLLGARLLQELAGAGRPRGQLDDGAGGRVGRPARPQGPRSVHRGDGRLGRVGGRRGRRSAWPARPGANEVYELFFRYGARDFRSIGHKAIYVANSWRTLQCIGWQHAEPVLRSLAYALLMHEDGNPADARRPGRPPLDSTTRTARPGSRRAGPAASPTPRPRPTCSPRSARAPSDDACEQVVELLNRGVAPAVDLGRPVRRRRRAAAPPAGDRLAARGDLDQRPALRLPGQRRRPDPPAADAPERRVPPHVPRGDGRPRQGRRRSDRPARAGRDVSRTARGPSRRSSRRPAATG